MRPPKRRSLLRTATTYPDFTDEPAGASLPTEELTRLRASISDEQRADRGESFIDHLARGEICDEGAAAWCYAHRKHWGWVTRAAQLGRNDAVALTTGGFALSFVVGELDEGAALIDRALALNPNLAMHIAYGHHQLARASLLPLLVIAQHRVSAAAWDPTPLASKLWSRGLPLRSMGPTHRSTPPRMGPEAMRRAGKAQAAPASLRRGADRFQGRLKLTREETLLREAQPPPGKGADVSNWLRRKPPTVVTLPEAHSAQGRTPAEPELG
jgi:hypothetical protein